MLLVYYQKKKNGKIYISKLQDHYSFIQKTVRKKPKTKPTGLKVNASLGITHSAGNLIIDAMISDIHAIYMIIPLSL